MRRKGVAIRTHDLIEDYAVNRDKKSLPRWIIVSALLVIGMILLVSLFGPISRIIIQHTPNPYYKSDEPLVEDAIRELYGDRASMADVVGHTYPVVVSLPDMKCVGFNVRHGVLGPTQTVCFRKSDRSVVLRHSE